MKLIEMKQQMDKFKAETGIQLDIMAGEPYYFDSIDLSYAKSVSLPENLIVGGNLYLYSANVSSLPNGLIVVGNLYLTCSSITELPDDLIVGGSIYLGGTQIKGYDKSKINRHVPNYLLETIKYNGRIYKLIYHYNGIWKIQKIGGKYPMFIVTNDNKNYALARTIKKAKEKLEKAQNKTTTSSVSNS